MQLEDLRLFVATLEAGSFTAAAERLGLSKQYVSRRTMALEEELGVRLLNRTTRRLSPTALGLTLLERARRILEEVDDTRQLLSDQAPEPRGILRLSAPMTFGTLHLGPLLPRFLQRYPQVQLDIDLNDRAVDLVAEGYDMAIRSAVLPDSTLVARRLAGVQLLACAAPAYLARHPAPETPEDLEDHDCLVYGHGSQRVDWTLQRDGKPLRLAVQGPMRANNGELLRDAAIAGLGIAFLPTFMLGAALADGRLVPVLEAFRPPESAVYAVYPQHRQSARPVQAMVEFLREALA